MKYGLIGEKLGHSFSKEIHAKIGDYDYSLKELKPDEVENFFKERNFLGINVTIPYKEVIIPYLDEVSQSARQIGAVNTVVNRGGKLYGYNTDYFGARDLILRADINLKDKKVLILGTGGTSKTLKTVACDLGAKAVIKVSRKSAGEAINYEQAYALHADADVIINTTPVGMYPNTDACPVDLNRFVNLCGVIDVIYNPINTKLVQCAKRKNVNATGGMYMLAGQAVYAQALFFDQIADKNKTEEVFRQVLKQKQNIVLIGMPSCGKTTVGKELERLTGKKYFDSDEEIVKTKNKQISDIFATEGESEFRKIECDIIEKLSKSNGCIISTGGGVVLNAENVNRLKQNGKLFFIDRPFEKLTATSDRPLSSTNKALKQRFEERYGIYVDSADYKIDADCTPTEVAQKILKVF